MPNTAAIKHTVADSEAQQRTHPVFEHMLEQFEQFTQTIQRLRRRRVLVKLPERERVYRLRVPKVPGSRLSAERLAAIKTALTKMVGVPVATLRKEIEKRAQLHGVPFFQPHVQAVNPYSRDEEFWQEV